MNDLISSNGKTTKYKDLGLKKSLIKNTNWPTPEQLARAARRETTPVAFRIDEVCYACLDLLATQHKMSLSSFVNELLNSYVEQNKNNIEGYVFNRTLNMYMERLSSKMVREKPSNLLRQFRMSDVEFIFQVANGRELPHDKKIVNEILKNFYENVIDKGYGQFLGYSVGFFNVHLSIVKDDEKARTTDARDWELEDKNIVNFCDFSLSIPMSKWVIVTTMLESFYLKSRQLFDEKWQKEHSLDLEKVEKLAEIINKNNGKNLIMGLAEFLRLSERWGDKSGGF